MAIPSVAAVQNAVDDARRVDRAARFAMAYSARSGRSALLNYNVQAGANDAYWADAARYAAGDSVLAQVGRRREELLAGAAVPTSQTAASVVSGGTGRVNPCAEIMIPTRDQPVAGTTPVVTGVDYGRVEERALTAMSLPLWSGRGRGYYHPQDDGGEFGRIYAETLAANQAEVERIRREAEMDYAPNWGDPTSLPNDDSIRWFREYQRFLEMTPAIVPEPKAPAPKAESGPPGPERDRAPPRRRALILD